jgi:hypothetical protein
LVTARASAAIARPASVSCGVRVEHREPKLCFEIGVRVADHRGGATELARRAGKTAGFGAEPKSKRCKSAAAIAAARVYKG